MTPSLALIRVGSGQGWSVPIVLPLFLLWIPLVLLAPLLLLVALGVSVCGRWPVWRGLRAFWDVSCALTGTDVDVLSDGHRVWVRLV